ncbi:DUF881 domain-containing protein [Schaalia vaccimaxillae]|uniref:DUF881 domain-containing protein n=1 Tax=Schaalia vaccimaxillae TaxID=183916 RepID=UPI0003B412C9|nr:DUF881 domain-containing protein [Schaalia vaccimaxillae]
MTEPNKKNGEESGRAWADPAASMSLLTDLLSNPLDAGYGYYANQERRRSRWWQRVLVIIVAMALGMASVLAVRSLRHPDDDGVTAQLLEQAQSQQVVVTGLESEVNTLSETIAGHGAQMSGGADILDPSVSLRTATSSVSGPGLVVTLSDADDAAALKRSSSGAVRDQDLNVVVNALWSAGAEAVSINGKRIGPSTFIRTAGSVILINVTPVQSPYQIEAIGDANAMSVTLVRGTTGDYLSSAQSINGISITTAGSSSLTMEALDPRVFKYAEAIDTPEGD